MTTKPPTITVEQYLAQSSARWHVHAGGRAVRVAGGTRADIGFYVRSRMEANYARYLAWLLAQGEITGWAYEPYTFDFPIARGTRTYTPDFAVWEKGADSPLGTTQPLPRVSSGKWHPAACRIRPPSFWVETKGWLDRPSKTRLRRMARFHPAIDLRVVDGRAMRAIAKSCAGVIDGWEGREHYTRRAGGDSAALRP